MTIGIAVALYNGEKFLKQQLDSLRLQSKPADKVVLCDDGSKDNTVKIVQDYIKEFSLENSWELRINEQNLGYARNFYHAMEICDTDLIYLSDQDDLWEKDKLEEMSNIMVQNPNINLLCCKHGIIDCDGNKMHSVLEKEGNSTKSLQLVTVENIMTAYRWPGMAMCVRGDFFRNLLPSISELKLAHDMVFVLTSADCDSFFEYDYIGVHHRRHGNNTANEESRIFKLLDLKRKLRDMRVYNVLLSGIIDAKLPLSEKTINEIKTKLDFSLAREEAVNSRNFKKLINAYRMGNKKTFRIASALCDIWLLCFGKYRNTKEN